MDNKNLHHWLIIISIVVLLTLPVLIQDGMFMDAIMYSSISRNLWEGNGTIWDLQFDVHDIYGLPSFSEQPPLAFWIQSQFFGVFGDTLYTERIYTFFCLLLNLLLITWLWKLIINNNSKKSYSWLPVLIWICIPIVFWSFRNNMLENTMSIFILLASIFIIKSYKNKRYFFLTIAGFCIFFATLSKGLPGLFPLIIPLIYGITFDKGKLWVNVKHILYLLALIAFSYVLLFSLFPDSYESLKRYFIERAIYRIQNEIPDGGRLHILRDVLQQLTPYILIITILLILYRKGKIKDALLYKKEAIFFLLIGLAGSIPLIFTPVQKLFYLTPSMPFFAIGFAFLFLPMLRNALEQIKQHTYYNNIIKYSSFILLLLSILITVENIGKTSRDKEVLIDVREIGLLIESGTKISTSTTFFYNWSPHFYLIRKYKIYPVMNTDFEYYLIDKRYDSPPTGNYEITKLDLHFFALYKLKDQ